MIAAATREGHGVVAPTACPGIDPVPRADHREARPSRARSVYLAMLTGAFTVFNSVRILAYLPTLWAIHITGDSSQHSLWTWLTWMGANATMAAWLYETNGQRLSRAAVINACNAVMCMMTVVLIVGHRL
ncbi:MAG TPA: hypothetical protein VK570_00690 [Rubrivivax sp.]|nr:hypothetical protein [Rubrivivax sp.]